MEASGSIYSRWSLHSGTQPVPGSPHWSALWWLGRLHRVAWMVTHLPGTPCLCLQTACPWSLQPALPFAQKGDFGLIYTVWWWMTGGWSEHTLLDSPGPKQPHWEAFQSVKLPLGKNQDKLLRAETTGPLSCSDPEHMHLHRSNSIIGRVLFMVTGG